MTTDTFYCRKCQQQYRVIERPPGFILFLNLFTARLWTAQKLGFCSAACSDKHLEDQIINDEGV